MLLHRETPLFNVYSFHSQLPDRLTLVRGASAQHTHVGQHLFLFQCLTNLKCNIILHVYIMIKMGHLFCSKHLIRKLSSLKHGCFAVSDRMLNCIRLTCPV